MFICEQQRSRSAEQAGLNLTWSKIPEDTFLHDVAHIILFTTLGPVHFSHFSCQIGKHIQDRYSIEMEKLSCQGDVCPRDVIVINGLGET